MDEAPRPKASTSGLTEIKGAATYKCKFIPVWKKSFLLLIL